LNGFSKILALVDFSDTSFHVCEEAAMIASKFNGDLYLLHVSPASGSSSYFSTPGSISVNKARLKIIRTELEHRFDLNIEVHEATGKLLRMVSKYVDKLHIDLVVLGAKRKNWFKDVFFESNTKKIIRSVNSEVLCVYPNSNSNRLKKIVLPIAGFIPKKKIRLAYELAKKFAANVHLVSLNTNRNNFDSEGTKALMDSYKYFKDITNIPIECRTIQGDDLAQATLKYAKNIEADLILVNTGKELNFGNALIKWAVNIVNRSSIPVLCVHSMNEVSDKQYRA